MTDDEAKLVALRQRNVAFQSRLDGDWQWLRRRKRHLEGLVTTMPSDTPESRLALVCVHVVLMEIVHRQLQQIADDGAGDSGEVE